VVVVCDKCDTRFHLGDARVPPEGARVRCSRCKHAFFIAHPGIAEADAIDEVVAEVTGSDGLPTPEVTQDLEDPNPQGGEPERRLAKRPAQPRIEDRTLGDFEEDWEFNDESPAGLEAEAEPEFSTIGEFDVSSPDLSGDFFDSSFAAEDADPIGEPEPEMPRAEEPPIDPVESIRARDAGLDPSSPDDLGSPEDWDFVGTVDVEPPLDLAPEEEDSEPVIRVADEVSSDSPAPVLTDSPTTAPAVMGETDRVPWATRLTGLASIAGWILVALAFLVGISAVLTPPGQGSAVIGRPTETSVPGLAVTASEVEGRLVENALAGNLLVVSGNLENSGSRTVAPGGAVSLQLVSARGLPIEGATAVAGRALPETRLREQDPDRLRRDLERSAVAMAHRSLRPGERVRFDAVFESIPESAAGWVFQAAISPGRSDPEDPLPSTTPLARE